MLQHLLTMALLTMAMPTPTPNVLSGPERAAAPQPAADTLDE